MPLLKQFIDEENQKYYDDADEILINNILNGDSDSEISIKNLEKQFKEEILEFADRIGPSDEEIFAQSFHRLIHSPLLPEILSREKSYASIVGDFSKKMDMELTFLITQQENEIKHKLNELDISTTSEVIFLFNKKFFSGFIKIIKKNFKDINRLITKQCGKRELIQKGYQSELDAIRGHQKNEYRNWITGQIEESLINSPVPTPIGNKCV